MVRKSKQNASGVITMRDAPTAWQVQQALKAVAECREALLETREEDDYEALIAALSSETDVFRVIAAIVRGAVDAKAKAEMAKARMEALAGRRARFVARDAAARKLAAGMLTMLGMRRFDDDPEFTVSVSPGRAGVVVDMERLPAEYVRQKIERSPDMTAINEALKDGVVIEGVTAGNGGDPVLTIRTR